MNLIKGVALHFETNLDPVYLIVQRKMLHNLLNVMENTTHPLHNLPLKQEGIFSFLRFFTPSAISTDTDSCSDITLFNDPQFFFLR